jgi:hypothetical protein
MKKLVQLAGGEHKGETVRLRDAVRIEIRAAAIAAGMLHDMSHDMIVEELVGWMRCGDNRERGDYPKSSAWQAGWLAAFIFGDDPGRATRRRALAARLSAKGRL